MALPWRGSHRLDHHVAKCGHGGPKHQKSSLNKVQKRAPHMLVP